MPMEVLPTTIEQAIAVVAIHFSCASISACVVWVTSDDTVPMAPTDAPDSAAAADEVLMPIAALQVPLLMTSVVSVVPVINCPRFLK